MDIKNKYLYFMITAIILCMIMFILYISDRIYYREEISIARYQYNKVQEDIIVTERDNQLKTIAMFNLIISTYGNKYHRRYNKKNKRRFQGLEPRWQQSLFVRKCYEYEKKLNIPYFTLITLAKIETAFNPLAETRWSPTKGKKEGAIKEAGIFQNRRSAVGEALMCLKKLYNVNPKLANNFEFKFENMKSLFDPLNALKIEALLIWGSMQETYNQQAWYITFVHWGKSRIAPYYYFRKNNGILPENFTFNKNTVREDVRCPLQYFGLFYSNWGRFSKFKIKVYVEQWYDRLYKKSCSKLEWQFIQSWKYVKELKERVEDIKEFELEAKKEHKKQLEKILKKTKEINKKYAQLHRQIKIGKFINIKSIFKMWNVHFKDLMNDLSPSTHIKLKVGKKEMKFSKGIIVMYFIFLGFMLIFFLFGFVITMIFIIKKTKYFRSKKHGRKNDKK